MKQFFDHFQIGTSNNRDSASQTEAEAKLLQICLLYYWLITVATFDKKLTSFLKSWERAVSLTAQSIVNTLSTSGPATAFIDPTVSPPLHTLVVIVTDSTKNTSWLPACLSSPSANGQATIRFF